jgi:hypothetical protein
MVHTEHRKALRIHVSAKLPVVDYPKRMRNECHIKAVLAIIFIPGVHHEPPPIDVLHPREHRIKIIILHTFPHFPTKNNQDKYYTICHLQARTNTLSFIHYHLPRLADCGII